ncbi:hypothetical protein F2P81_009242 [Scophthalmus maximus]|uniref:Uncharacterized protein n=1 Tax=Scophthalmus maximus TaxID=52904 RepID=A0A6A4T341_SCOMX|nr:hypothetical protein F2P81_009242 [Scophthalmus maximus]
MTVGCDLMVILCCAAADGYTPSPASSSGIHAQPIYMKWIQLLDNLQNAGGIRHVARSGYTSSIAEEKYNSLTLNILFPRNSDCAFRIMMSSYLTDPPQRQLVNQLP